MEAFVLIMLICAGGQWNSSPTTCHVSVADFSNQENCENAKNEMLRRMNITTYFKDKSNNLFCVKK